MTTFAKWIAAIVLPTAGLGLSLHAQPATTNRVLELDGTGSYVELPPNSFNNLSQATIEAWMRWDDLSGEAKRAFNYGDARRDMSISSLDGGSATCNFQRIADHVSGFRHRHRDDAGADGQAVRGLQPGGGEHAAEVWRDVFGLGDQPPVLPDDGRGYYSAK